MKLPIREKKNTKFTEPIRIKWFFFTIFKTHHNIMWILVCINVKLMNVIHFYNYSEIRGIFADCIILR